MEDLGRRPTSTPEIQRTAPEIVKPGGVGEPQGKKTLYFVPFQGLCGPDVSVQLKM